MNIDEIQDICDLCENQLPLGHCKARNFQDPDSIDECKDFEGKCLRNKSSGVFSTYAFVPGQT